MLLVCSLCSFGWYWPIIESGPLSMDVNNKCVFCIFSNNRRQHNESHNFGLYLMGGVWVCGMCGARIFHV